jgi:hypothetical protein
MSKLKIEHGVSRIKRAKLQTYIDQTVADDIALMADWTNNEPHYVVNELLRFALGQSKGFQIFKTEQGTKPSRNELKPLPLASNATHDPVASAPESSVKPRTPINVTANRV